MGLSSRAVVHGQDFRDISATKQATLGAVGETADGRVYRYAKAGGADLAPGKLVVAATVDSNVTNKTIARTVAAGATSVVFDAAGAVTADAYADGFLTINDATGEGISYAIQSHTGTTGAGEVTVFLKEPLKVGLTIDVSEGTLTANPFAGVVISATDQADVAVGVPNVTITTAYYGWVQTRGLCAVLADEAIAIGQAVTIGSGVAGAVEAADLIGEQNLGYAIVAGVDTEYREIFLAVD